MLTSRLGARFLSTHAQHHKIAVKPINKLLIANRGEIACRIIKTARRLGVRTVAIYSDADKNSLHAESADEAYNVGPAVSQQSYLRGDRIVDIAKMSGCQAIHPGYGFLSESVEFAEKCEAASVIFMGPPASAIRDMGIKSTSKHIMSAAGVPVIYGYHGEDQNDAKLIEEASKIGFPLMIKAVRGGGGKGMRIVSNVEDFIDALNSARNESQKSFGDSSVLLEKFVRSPRHVEVQVFADQHGNAVYLFERDCSVQRRHQKIIEEAPAPGLSEELRRQLGEAAVRAAKAVGYVGAGTVEFIMDKTDLSFHFMEMNTRLQVEHPITEMITGTDLVEWQIQIASGEPLPLKQEEIIRRGHAFEARIYAENPRGGFLPGAGPLKHLTTPAQNEHVRVETGVRQGDEVSVHYDPMIAKLVVWGKNRTQALDSLISRLREYHITGLETNVNFLIDLASHSHFRSGEVHTGFIDEHFQSLFPELKITDKQLSKAVVALVCNELNAANINSRIRRKKKGDPFISAPGFRPNYDLIRDFVLGFNGTEHRISLKMNDQLLEVRVGDSEWRSVKATSSSRNGRVTLRCTIDGEVSVYSVVINSEGITMFDELGKTQLDFLQPQFLQSENDVGRGSGSRVTSPMPGLLERLHVKPGDCVKQGDAVAIIIAMKMEYILKAPKDGIVKSVGGKPGDNIGKGAVVVAFEEDDK